jgi:hypothetical protein
MTSANAGLNDSSPLGLSEATLILRVIFERKPYFSAPFLCATRINRLQTGARFVSYLEVQRLLTEVHASI